VPYKIDSKLKQRLISRIRREWHWSKQKKDALKAAECDEGYTCALCDGLFPKKQVQVDHINPVVDPDVGFQGFDVYLERMFCPAENLRILCKECHVEVTRGSARRLL
jgi:5-methylcytosine-specific restriction endonuclease McrA